MTAKPRMMRGGMLAPIRTAAVAPVALMVRCFPYILSTMELSVLIVFIGRWSISSYDEAIANNLGDLGSSGRCR